MTQEYTRVTFIVSCSTTDTERVVIAGSDPALGGWDPLRRGVKLTESSHGLWSVTVSLRAGKRYEYKYYVVEKEDSDTATLFSKSPGPQSCRGETFDINRKLTTSGQAMEISDGEFNKSALGESRIKLIEKVVDQAERVLIIALYRLPIISQRDSDGNWSFDWDDDALYSTSVGFRKGIGSRKVLWVGILNTSFEVSDDEVPLIRKELFDKFQCYPLFIPKATLTKFYQGFCKGVLWPIFHTVNHVSDQNGHTSEFDDGLWKVYNEVNEVFAKAVIKLHEVGAMIWIHDYHLMVLPAYLRKQLSGAHIGFFLHIPWPSSEAYRILPMREKILAGLLSSSLIGFNLFDYTRHFLSACVRILNVQQESSRGTIGISYGGRHVVIRVSHIGIHPERFSDAISTSSVQEIQSRLREKYKGKFVLGGIDDLDFIKGISLKLEAFETLLESIQKYRDQVVLYQVAVPKAARVQERIRDEIRNRVKRINERFGTPHHTPVEYVENDIPFAERVALYRVTDALFLTPIRDGLNLIPYEYLISTEDSGNGQLILSEFIGCSRALSSALRLNPWSPKKLADSIDLVIQRDPQEVKGRHVADTNYVKSHTTEKWIESFLKDLETANEPVQNVLYLGLGLGIGKRLVEFAGYSRLSIAEVLKSYRSSDRRLFLLDYDGTLTSTASSSRMEHAWARPHDKAIGNLQRLADDRRNTIYILSGRTTEILESNFGDFRAIGIAGEHGFYYREPWDTEWKTQKNVELLDRSWIESVHKIMQSYTRRTDGSYIEVKSVGLVWHYADADPEFGIWQAKEMQQHLRDVLRGTEVEVIAGFGWLQVRYRAINKGTMVSRILGSMLQEPSFVLCIGDDRTDEDMFSYLDDHLEPTKSTVFTCTVGIQPSRARYYLRHSDEVVNLLGSLTTNELRSSVSSPEDVKTAIL
eukprot:CAMPEP_0184745042 /NCGR_PEP_ID=MMETSP0315-20130426/7775_1 /TAXON_ID=101924 /ORGANISM="Rhodosorus marinus, Strain UTEX LB 2760" /LENGTH=925 /DNA_ID=CAMNT_0027217055 /DNA_START=83 /DNA_END=2860 /DNA_ORIENTATION=+